MSGCMAIPTRGKRHLVDEEVAGGTRLGLSNHSISLTGAVVLGGIYMGACLSGRLAVSDADGVVWSGNNLRYLFLGVHVLLEVMLVVCMAVGKYTAGLYYANVLVAYDTISRGILSSVIPAVHVVFPIFLAAVFLSKRAMRVRLGVAITLLTSQTILYAVTPFLRGDSLEGSGVLMMLVFTGAALIYYLAPASILQIKQIWIHLATCALIASVPDLILFCLNYNEGMRLNPLQLTSGANTYGSLLALVSVGFLMSQGSGWRRLFGQMAFATMGGVILLGGSRWQVLCWLLGALLLMRGKMRLVLLVVMGLLGFAVFWGHSQANFMARMSELGSSLSSRMEINSLAWTSYKEGSLALGVGYAQWSDISARELGRVWPVHNVILAQFVYGGALVGILNVALLVWLAYLAVRYRLNQASSLRHAAIALLLFVIIQQSIFYYNYGAFCVLGMALASGRFASASPNDVRKDDRCDRFHAHG